MTKLVENYINKTSEEKQATFKMPDCIFAGNVCGDCYWNDGGWCKKKGGWVDLDRWACSDFA